MDFTLLFQGPGTAENRETSPPLLAAPPRSLTPSSRLATPRSLSSASCTSCRRSPSEPFPKCTRLSPSPSPPLFPPLLPRGPPSPCDLKERERERTRQTDSETDRGQTAHMFGECWGRCCRPCTPCLQNIQEGCVVMECNLGGPYDRMFCPGCDLSCPTLPLPSCDAPPTTTFFLTESIHIHLHMLIYRGP